MTPRRLLRALVRHSGRTLAVGAVAGVGWLAAAALGPLAVSRAVDALADDRTDAVAAWVGVLLALGALEAGCTALRHRQAITAYAGTTRLLVLDGAGSALDAVTVALSGRAVVVVAHRLATALAADRVVVLDGGRVVEQGPPADLLRSRGPFASLAAAAGIRSRAGTYGRQ